MAKLKVNTSGIDKMIAGINKAKKVIDVSNIVIEVAALYSQSINELVKETPVGDAANPQWHKNSRFLNDRTHLKEHWRHKVEASGTKVSAKVFLDKAELDELVDLLESGAAAHMITPKLPDGVLKFFVKEGGSYKKVYAKSVKHPGFKANRFVDRVGKVHSKRAKKLQNKILEEFTKAIKGV